MLYLCIRNNKITKYDSNININNIVLGKHTRLYVHPWISNVHSERYTRSIHSVLQTRRCGRRISSDLSSNSQDVQKHSVGHSSSRSGLLLVPHVRDVRRHPEFILDI